MYVRVLVRPPAASLSCTYGLLAALNPFEEHVDAEFVQETALKQTLILLGLEEK